LFLETSHPILNPGREKDLETPFKEIACSYLIVFVREGRRVGREGVEGVGQR
jgi:hypothetical protein